jgi:outer membrane protein OmpA-like peptidoglycan-associated protein
MKKLLVAIPIVVLAVGGATGCASKGFVKDRVGEVNTKVETLSKSLEETQEQTRQNTQRIGQAEQNIKAVDQKFDQKTAAVEAVATDAKTTATGAATKASEVEKASKRLVYEVTLSEDQGGFAFGKAELPTEATTRIDELVNQLKANPNGAFIEVEGYTDSVGDKIYNEKLGLERAEAVKRYLYEKHQIPLHKINVISYGQEKPIAPNTTRAGRAKNRRVVIKVLV